MISDAAQLCNNENEVYSHYQERAMKWFNIIAQVNNFTQSKELLNQTYNQQIKVLSRIYFA